MLCVFDRTLFFMAIGAQMPKVTKQKKIDAAIFASVIYL